MELRNLLNPEKTVLLVIDVQQDYCSERGKLASTRKVNVQPVQKMVSKLIQFVDIARDCGVKIVFVRMNKTISQVPENLRTKLQSLAFPFSESLCVPGTMGFEYYQVAPKKGDFEVVKNSYDAFSSQELDLLLRRLNIKNIIVTGVYSQICVDATVKNGFSRGFNIIVPEDLVATSEETAYQQKAIVDIWESYFAFVVHSKDIITFWKPTG